MKKNTIIILLIVSVTAIEFSGRGVFTSLLRLLGK